MYLFLFLSFISLTFYFSLCPSLSIMQCWSSYNCNIWIKRRVSLSLSFFISRHISLSISSSFMSDFPFSSYLSFLSYFYLSLSHLLVISLSLSLYFFLFTLWHFSLSFNICFFDIYLFLIIYRFLIIYIYQLMVFQYLDQFLVFLSCLYFFL